MQNYNFNFEQYKKRINKNSKIFLPLIIFAIIILLGLSFYLKPSSTKAYEYYFVEISSFETYSASLNLANEIKEKNGAGFIFYEEKYRVIANCYNNKNDAKTVANNLKSNYKNARLYTLKIECIKFNLNFNNLQKQSVKNVFSKTDSIINLLCKLNLQLDKQEISNNEFLLKLKSIYLDYANTLNDFFNAFKENSKYNTSKQYLEKISTSINEITELERLSSYEIKFKTINIIACFNSFSKSF